VYAVGSPAAGDDIYQDGSRTKETRNKLYLQDATTYQAKVAAEWRDDGIVFYAPTSVAACGSGALAPVYEEEATDPGYNLLHRYYYSSLAEGAAWERLPAGAISWAGIPSRTQPFSVCSAQPTGSVPLKRVTYTFPTKQNVHDELTVGQARYDLARCQGNTTASCASVNHSLWSIRYSGLAAPAQIVVEALDAGCPYPGGLLGPAYYAGGADPFGGGFSTQMDPIFPMSKSKTSL
jgi:hypothetical protein